MTNSFYLLLITIIFASLSSCADKKPEFVSGQFDDIEKLISETDSYSATYFVNEEEVKIRVEDLLNTSDNRSEEFPALDFLAIRVDMNNNNLPDNNVDKAYSISQVNSPCMNYVLDEGNASTGCIEEEGFVYEVMFSASDKSSEEHIIYEFLIRREFIFEVSETVGLIFVMSGNDSGGANPFLLTPLFKETIEFSL